MKSEYYKRIKICFISSKEIYIKINRSKIGKFCQNEEEKDNKN